MQNLSLYTIMLFAQPDLSFKKHGTIKVNDFYADLGRLDKCFNFLHELNIFEDANETHQKMQNSWLYTMTLFS